MSMPNDICFFWYSYSPYARKIAWYLNLRGIKHAQCIQPGMMPRPDLEALNINYRRIPLLSIGKDVYCDTRLILKKLETMFPSGAIGARTEEHRIIERLLDRWTTDANIFFRAVQLIPLNLPTMKDDKFLRDRAQLSGRPWNRMALLRARPEALVQMRDAFEILESTILADGREWIFDTEKPSLGDIEAVWPLHWLESMPGALEASYISATQFPKTFAYIARFQKYMNVARLNAPKPVKLTGEEVAKHLSQSRFYESVGEVDANDPLRLEPGEQVTVHPLDSGFANPDTGKLLSLTPNEVVISKQTKAADNFEIHLHMPRWGYRVSKAKEGRL